MSQPMGQPMGQPMLDIARTPPIPFARLVRVELRKAFDTLASFWLFVAIAVLVIIVEGFFFVVGLVNGTDADLTFTAFTLPIGYVLQPALATLAIMLVTSEWGQRTAMVTFALEARRARVVYAKLVGAALLAVLLILALLVIALVCMAVLELSNPDGTAWDFGPADFAGLVVFELLAVAIGYALATLILNTPAAVAAYPVLAYVIPLGLGFVGLFWHDFRAFARYVNLQSSLAPVANGSLDTGAEWGHLIVSLLLWLVVPLVVGQVRITRAEVK